MLITEYLLLQQKYEKQYGPRTILLMQVGTFYECWSYDVNYCTSEDSKIDKDGKLWNESIGNAPEISLILNSVLTHENNSEPYGICNPFKVGFPVIAYEKNRDTLLSNDYTVVRMDQSKTGKGNITRFVAEICSPTMQIDYISTQRATSNVVCIYIEYQQGIKGRYENFLITTGVSVVDIITGTNRVCEFYSKNEDEIHPVQELYRFLISHNPRELIVHISDMPSGMDSHTEENPNPYVKYLEKVLELRRFDRLNVHVNSLTPEIKKIPYQIEFLNKIFKKPQLLNILNHRNDKIIEELGLERMNYGRVAYILLMQHCYSYNSEIITKLSNPDLQWIDQNNHLILTHNAILQLDLISPNIDKSRSRKKSEIDSLMSILDHNQTHLGRRLLYTILQNPMLNPDDINKYYDMVDEMISSTVGTEPLWNVLDRNLKELPDIGRLQRKLELKLITPKELAVLFNSYIKLINIYIIVLNTSSPVLHKNMFNSDEIASFNSFINKYSTMINFEALECCSIDTSAESSSKYMDFGECPIKPGIYHDLDACNNNLTEAENLLQQIVDHLNRFLESSRGKKLEFRSAKKKQGAKKQDPTGIILSTTASKATTLINSGYDRILCGILRSSPYTSGENIITSDKIESIIQNIDGIRTWMRQRLLTIYDSFLDDMTSKYTFYPSVSNLVAKLDLLHSYAKVSSKFKYYRPHIITKDCPSYLEANEIRHPIIEQLLDGVYVNNDIAIGNNHDSRPYGILLYGVNQTGKSSLAKAVAINIIMAQAGCFVPSKLKYKPYSKIITRLSGNDNIFKGQSSFAVEMSELRTILRQSDHNTLVIGDELAKGTESNSATAITASTILSLVESKTSFIFATHMHEVINLSSIKEIINNKLRICHLSISYDEINKLLIYDRKLKDGPGASVYGLTVAKSLNLPNEFIERANNILLEVTKCNTLLLDTKSSRYNNKIFVDSCANCGKNRSQTDLHTHHIIEQQTADDKGYVNYLIQDSYGNLINIGMMKKHMKDNLIVLCRDCHTNLHKTGTELQTLNTSCGTIIKIKS